VLKACKRCSQCKPLSSFRADPRYRDGVGSWCIECHRGRNSDWAKENRKRLNEKARLWRTDNIETSKASNVRHKRLNKIALAEKNSEWVKQNREKRRASYARRRAAKIHATPPWADPLKIAAIYKTAIEIERRTKQRMHVDHIIPLQHPLVCGLHCEANLQIIPGSANESKRNKFEPRIQAAFDAPDLFIERPKPAKQEAFLL
jgi:hypothetical protein